MTIATPAPQVVSERGARVLRVPPPLYYTAGFAAGMLLRGTGLPLTFGASRGTVITGAVLVAAGATLAAGGIAQVVRARTTIVPHRAVSALLTTGAYRVSRNPMYTGLAIAYLGGVPLAGSWWPLLTWPVALLAVRLLVIGPERALPRQPIHTDLLPVLLANPALALTRHARPQRGLRPTRHILLTSEQVASVRGDGEGLVELRPAS